MPFQQFRVGKQCNRYQKVKFPKGFSININEKNYCNSGKVIQYLEDIDIPYLNKERQQLGKPGHPAFLTLGCFPRTNG